MTGFREHRGWCPRGAPPDGETRLDVFPDHSVGDLLPVWRGGVAVHPPISDDLARALVAWNVAWERRLAADASAEDPAWRGPWRATGVVLAGRLHEETGHHVVLLWPELDGRDESCPECRTMPWET